MRKLIKKIYYFFLGLIPKKNNKIVFESHPDLTDSSKALYDYLMSKPDKNYQFVWLVDQPERYAKLNFPNTKFINLNKPISLKYIYNVCSSKYVVFCNREVRWIDLKKQKVLNLTHGLPIKSCKGFFPKDHTFNYLLSTSDFMTPYLADEYLSDINKCFVCGLPRNDVLFQENAKVKNFISKYDHFILWLPTYKKHKSESIIDSKRYENQVIPLFSVNGLNELNSILKDKNILLLLKFHPAQDLSAFEEISYSNLLFWKNEDLIANDLDLYSLLGYADALITDYSSVAYDFILRDKPIGFVQDDIDDYRDSRGFVFENMDEMCPGDKIKTEKQFIDFIENVTSGFDEYKMERKKIKNLLHTYQNGNYCEYITKMFDL